MSEAATNNQGTISGSNNVYDDPPPEESVYDEDPAHLQEAPWQSYLDTRFGVLTRSFTNMRSAAEVDRRMIETLFDAKEHASHAATLSLPKTLPSKTATPATLAERVRGLCGRM